MGEDRDFRRPAPGSWPVRNQKSRSDSAKGPRDTPLLEPGLGLQHRESRGRGLVRIQIHSGTRAAPSRCSVPLPGPRSLPYLPKAGSHLTGSSLAIVVSVSKAPNTRRKSRPLWSLPFFPFFNHARAKLSGRRKSCNKDTIVPHVTFPVRINSKGAKRRERMRQTCFRRQGENRACA